MLFRSLLVVWLVVCFLLLTLIWAKDVRYALICLPAVVIAWAEGCRGWHQQVVARLLPPQLTTWVWSGLAVMAGLASMIVVDPQVPHTRGIREIAAEVLAFAPRQPIFYYGELDGLLIYYLRLADPDFQQQVIPAARWVGDNLDVDSARETMVASGVKWLLIERPPPGIPALPRAFIEKLLVSPHIHRVKVLQFQTRGRRVRTVEVYELRGQPPGDATPGPEGISWKRAGRLLTPLSSPRSVELPPNPSSGN